MSGLVQLTIAGDVAEAEEIEALLAAAGIDCQIERAVEGGSAGRGDAPQRVLVGEARLEEAMAVLEETGEAEED